MKKGILILIISEKKINKFWSEQKKGENIFKLKLFNDKNLLGKNYNIENSINKNIKEILEKSKEKKIQNIICHCKRTKCLKNYCECFSNGKYCVGCKCNNCFNNEKNLQKIEKVKQISFMKSQFKNN